DNATYGSTGYLDNNTGALLNIGGNNSFTAPTLTAAFGNPTFFPGEVLSIAAANQFAVGGAGTNLGNVIGWIGSNSGTLDLIGGNEGANNNGAAANPLIKVGAGTYRTSGATPNDLVGATFVLGGTLELNKTPGVD